MKTTKTQQRIALSTVILTTALTAFACGTELTEAFEAPSSETHARITHQVESGLARLDLAQVATRADRPVPQRPALRALELDQLAKNLDFPTVASAPGVTLVKQDRVLIDHNAHRGTLVAIHQPEQLASSTVEEVRAKDAEFLQRHDDLMRALGVAAAERVDVEEPKLLMGRGYEKVDGQMQPRGEPVVHGVSIFSRRMIDDVPVEGSRAAVLFDPQGKVMAVNVDWPAFELHPELAAAGLKDQAELVDGIATRVLADQQDADAELKMGLVYRPVVYRDRVVHVPSVAVAVTPESGDAGEVFFADTHKERMEFGELTAEMVPEDIGSLAR